MIRLSGTGLSERSYAPTGGEPPEWTFASTPASTTRIVNGIGPAAVGEPPQVVPIFRYYAYEDADEDGAIETVPLKTPLSKTDASQTVRVDVAFTVVPPIAAPGHPKRRSPLPIRRRCGSNRPSEDSAQVNMPCV